MRPKYILVVSNRRVSEPVIRDIARGVRQLTILSAISHHVYLIDTDEGVVALDSAIMGSGTDVLAAAAGSVAKVILSHSHVDHRGGALELGAPIYCHPDEIEDAEGAGGQHYIKWDLVESPTTREGLPQLHALWDGGPVSISGTIDEGDEIAGFRVIHLPGHAPGLIALYREGDRLLLAPDVVFTIDPETGHDVPARVAHPAFNWDTELARASIEKLRPLGAASVWLGHGEHLSGDIAAQLDAAAKWPSVAEPRGA
jgi:hydroxyacylglutathione hydrolase